MEENKGKGIGFLGTLTLIFITLKLCKIIDWSWLWVLAPTLIPLVMFLLSAIVVGVITILKK
ncbi:hypothetical protein [Sebaldella sp. S0638]|uniref:hypothetical protein n=1 Tax=Sebaldella sp. S0638 TaxID=2957809 RepID=UPI0020A158DC|nr:hypothetical protein [Sebaldella sp. S0638]MCP1226287.1 hypothetical protein [Sebaldella sp. S0638]